MPEAAAGNGWRSSRYPSLREHRPARRWRDWRVHSIRAVGIGFADAAPHTGHRTWRGRRCHHHLYFGVQQPTEIGAAVACWHHRERLQHRRTPGLWSGRSRPAGATAVLVLWQRERDVGDAYTWRGTGPARQVRAGRGDRPDRAAPLHGALHAAGDHQCHRLASGIPAGAGAQPAHRPDHRCAAGHHCGGDGARCARDLQRLRPDRELRQLLRHAA